MLHVKCAKATTAKEAEVRQRIFCSYTMELSIMTLLLTVCDILLRHISHNDVKVLTLLHLSRSFTIIKKEENIRGNLNKKNDCVITVI